MSERVLLRNWRVWLLTLLFVGPSLIYMGLGALWLAEHRGPLGFPGELLLYGVLLWAVTGLAFAVLARRWTGKSRPFLPPLDWGSPDTFSTRDTEAWEIVRAEAEQADTLPIDVLSRFDTYEKCGLTIARRLANHYHPESQDPIDHVPIVELLTALQLAAEDLARMCRDLPGGDLVTPAHCKRAAKAAGYVQRASDLYNVLLPVFQPLTGMARLGVQKLVVQPAWQGMQRNLLRWFFEAYLNRLGFHLVELYSGRLAAGAETYRKLSRKHVPARVVEAQARPLTIAVVGARGSGRSSLIEGVQLALAGDLTVAAKGVERAGHSKAALEPLKYASLVETAAYPPTGAGGEELDAKLWEQAVAAAASADLVVMTLDAGGKQYESDRQFVEAWEHELAGSPPAERPPLLAVLTHADRPELGSGWFPPYDWANGLRPREQAIRRQIRLVQTSLAPRAVDVVVVGSPPGRPATGFSEGLVPELAIGLQRAERSALLRALRLESGRSTAGRFLGQLGRKGKDLLREVKPRFWRRSRSS